MPVTHCVCENLPIARILAWARANGTTDLDRIGAALGCGTHCGMCRPFVEYALKTGIAVVPYPLPDAPPASERWEEP